MSLQEYKQKFIVLPGMENLSLSIGENGTETYE